MPLDELKKHMQGNGSFLSTNKIANLNDLASLRAYRRYLLNERAVALSPDMPKDTSIRSGILTRMNWNDLFKDKTTPVLDKVNMLYDKVSQEDALDLIQGHYIPWLLDELDDVHKTMDTLAAQDVTGSSRTGVLKQQYTTLEKEQVEKGVQAGIRYQKAKADKTALKEEVKKFLGVKKFGTFSALRGTVTDDAIQLLEQEITRIDQELESMERVAREESGTDHIGPRSLDLDEHLLKSWRKDFLERREKAEKYIEQLKGRRLEKSQALQDYDTLSKQALDEFNKVDAQFREQNKKFIKGIEDLAKTIKAEEEVILKKKTELEKLVADIDSLFRKIWEENNTKESNEELLKAKELELRKLLRSGGDKERLKAIEKATKKLNEENKKLKADILGRETNIPKMQTQLETLRGKIPILSCELALIDKRYSVLRDCVDQISQQQRELVDQRNELREELDWMKKLKTVDSGLAVYCSTSKVCFPLLLNIGKLAAGEACGPLGILLAGSISGLSTVQKVMSSGNLKDLIMSAGTGVVGIGTTTGALAKIHSYDTGSFNLNLALGLSVGKSVGGAKVKGGIALVYSAGFTQEDDRHFRTVFTLSVEAYGEFAIPELLEAELAVELVSETTGMTFQDVYHWAAWLAQKWANIAAMVRASKFFDVTDEWGMPTDLRKRQMMDMAKITMANDPQLFQIFQDTMKYVNAPVIRMMSRDYLGAVSGGITVAQAFGAGGTVMTHPQDPKYTMRVTTEETTKDGTRRLEKELSKEGRQITQSGWLMAFVRVDYTYSNVTAHAVVDNEGKNYIFSVTLSGLSQQTGFEKPGQEVSGRIAEWVEKTLAPVLKVTDALPGVFDAVQESSSLGCFNQVTGSVGTDSIQICLYRSVLSRGDSKVVLMYWRPVFTANLETSGEIETGVPGLNIDLSMGVNLTRTYCENLGINTITYVCLVFNGFMNITSFDKKPEDEPRPEHARGTTLWARWAEQNNNSLYLMMKRIAEDDANKEWITKEVLDQGGTEFVKWLRGQKKLFTQKKSLVGNYALDKDALKRFKDFLYSCYKSKDYQDKMKKGWEPVPVSEFRFSLNPIVMAREIARSRTQAYKLDSALRSLGPRRGLKELYAEEARKKKEARLIAHQKDNWVPDDQADRCANCNVQFSKLVWKHHCRECGKIFCADCLPFKIELPDRGYKTKEKVCAACYQKVTEALEEHHAHTHTPTQQHQAPHTQLQAPPKEKDLYGVGESELGSWNVTLGESVHHPTSGLLFVGRADPSKVMETISGLKSKSDVPLLFSKGPVTKPPEKKPEDKAPEPIMGGYKEIDAGAGGDCMFRSVSMAVFGNADQHLELRRTAVQHMEGFKAGVRSSLTMEKESGLARQDVLTLMHDHPNDFVDKYLTRMKQPGMWGGAPELRALCRILKRRIIVHKKQGPAYPVFIEAVEEKDPRFLSTGAPIHILYVGQSHYKCLQPSSVQDLQPAQDYHLLSYHGTSSTYRSSLKQGLKPTTSVWDPATGGALGPGFYTTKDYAGACTYGVGMAGAKGGGVDVWAVESLIPLDDMKGHGIESDQQFHGVTKELCDQYHYFFSAAEVEKSEIKFNEWAYPLLRLRLHKEMSVDEADKASKSTKKPEKK